MLIFTKGDYEICASCVCSFPVDRVVILQAAHAEQAGAVAIVIVNDSNDYFIMTDDGSGRMVKIHSFLISKSDGDQLKLALPCTSSSSSSSCSRDPSAKVLIGFGLDFHVRDNYVSFL